MDKDDQEWVAAQLSEIDNPEEDFETELFLSTDGKHTVKVKSLTNDTRPKALKFAQKLFDRVLERYGSKQSTAVREYSKADSKDKCPTCGNALVEGITKNGKAFIKCSTNKWNFTTKQNEGCSYILWKQSK